MALLAAMAALSLAGCFAAPDQSGATQTQTVGAQGGTVKSADGKLTLQIPPGALRSAQAVTVSVASGSPVPSSAQALGEAYEVGPALSFAVPVQVTLSLPDGASASGALVFSAAAGHVATAPLAGTSETVSSVSAWIPSSGVIQLAHAISVTNGPTGGTTSTSVSSTSTTTGGTTTTTGGTGSTTGGGTTGGTTGYCGGAVGTIGGGGRPEEHEDEAVYCNNGPTDEVDCYMGNCRCLTSGVEFASYSLPTNDHMTAWQLCGFPPNPTLYGTPAGCTGTCLAPPAPASGTATVDGDLGFAATVNTFVYSNGSTSAAPTSLVITLAQSGVCGGFEATGKTVYIGISSPNPIVAGTYPLADFDTPQPRAEISLGDYDTTLGFYGVVADRVSGSVVVTSLVGDQISGTYTADVQLTGTATHKTLSGSFTSVPACTPGAP